MVELFLQAQEVSLLAAVETHHTVSSLHKRHGIKNFSVLQQSVPTGDPKIYACVYNFTVKFLQNTCLQCNTKLHLLTLYIMILRINSSKFQIKQYECEKTNEHPYKKQLPYCFMSFNNILYTLFHVPQ